MRIRVILAAVAVTTCASGVFADPLRPLFGGVLPPAKISALVRSMGLLPTGRPVREGMTYAIVATDPRGRQLRVVIDARFGDVLSVRRVVAAGPPGSFPPPRAYGAFPGRPPGPYTMPWMAPDFRPPAMIGRAPAPANPDEKAGAKSAATPNPPTAVVTIGPAAAPRGTDSTPTGSAKASSFPPAQTLE